MTDATTPHDDLAAYLLQALTPEERERFERHLDSCAACRGSWWSWMSRRSWSRTRLPPYALPRGLAARTFATIEREAAGPPRPILLPHTRRRYSRVLAVGAVAAVAALAFVVGTRLDRPAGSVELRTALVAPDGDRAANAEVRRTGIGRVIRFESDELPILPKGEYYELWFVGPGDTPADAEPDLGRHVPPRRGRPLTCDLRGRSRSGEVPRAERDSRARRRKSRAHGAGGAAFSRGFLEVVPPA